MDDDWRLQIDLDDDGIGGKLADLCARLSWRHELAAGLGTR